MTFDDNIVAAANRIRGLIQRHPKLPTIDHGESVAIVLWYGFLCDHAECMGIPVEKLAHDQLHAFMEYAAEDLKMIRPKIN